MNVFAMRSYYDWRLSACPGHTEHHLNSLIPLKLESPGIKEIWQLDKTKGHWDSICHCTWFCYENQLVGAFTENKLTSQDLT